MKKWFQTRLSPSSLWVIWTCRVQKRLPLLYFSRFLNQSHWALRIKFEYHFSKAVFLKTLLSLLIQCPRNRLVLTNSDQLIQFLRSKLWIFNYYLLSEYFYSKELNLGLLKFHRLANCWNLNLKIRCLDQPESIA